MAIHSIKRLIADLQDLANCGYKTLTDKELDRMVLGRVCGLSVGDTVFVVAPSNNEAFEAVVVAWNNDGTVTVQSELTGHQYTVGKDYVVGKVSGTVAQQELADHNPERGKEE